MSYAFSDQQSKLSSLLGDSNTGTDDMFPLATRKKEINRGEMRFCTDSKLVREKTSGTISSAQIAWPSDCLEPYLLIVAGKVLTNDREVSVKDYERFVNYGGSPPFYYITEESGVRYFKFFGTSTGSAYIFYYFKKPSTELSSDSDTSILPEEYREASVYYAASQLMQQVGKNEISDRYLAIYQGLVKEAQAYAERFYMDKNYAIPDLNHIDNNTTDVQGGGFDYGS